MEKMMQYYQCGMKMINRIGVGNIAFVGLFFTATAIKYHPCKEARIKGTKRKGSMTTMACTCSSESNPPKPYTNIHTDHSSNNQSYNTNHFGSAVTTL